jgi:hypothetical protein
MAFRSLVHPIIGSLDFLEGVMDDLAPAPAQRTSDSGGRTTEGSLAARKKAVKKVQAVPVQKRDPEPQLAPEPDPDHQLDVLA